MREANGPDPMAPLAKVAITRGHYVADHVVRDGLVVPQVAAHFGIAPMPNQARNVVVAEGTQL
jgi:hypothetical protein